MKSLWPVVAVFSGSLAAACGAGGTSGFGDAGAAADAGSGSGGGSGSSGGGSSGGGGGSGSSSGGSGGSSGGGSSGGGSGSGGSSGAGPTEAGTGACAVPSTPAALNAWLQTGAYKAYPHESAPHVSAGPHPGMVQAYLSPNLDASLMAGNADNPQCSAVVKEYSGSASGWAVWVKLQPASNGGQNIFWYEIFTTAAGASPASSGTGDSECTGCHSMGHDF